MKTIAEFPSRSTPGETHLLKRCTEGELVCSCTGFKYTNHCAHIDVWLDARKDEEVD